MEYNDPPEELADLGDCVCGHPLEPCHWDAIHSELIPCDECDCEGFVKP